MRIKTIGKFLILTISSWAITALAGCSSLAPLVASETPTTTQTPLPTKTPLPTATATKIPSPLEIWGCLYAEACNSAYDIKDFFGETDVLIYNIQYPVTVYTENEVWFFYQWCAVDSTTLDQNLQELEFEFAIDDVSYADRADQGYATVEDPAIPSDSHPCYSIGATLSGWKDGKPHKVAIGAHILTDIFDGWRTSAAGYYLYVFMVNPIGIATPLPPTFTPTIELCEASSSILLSNTTSENMNLYLTGPRYFYFYLPPHTFKRFPVCPGSYTMTVNVCGTSRTVDITDGSSLVMNCTTP